MAAIHLNEKTLFNAVIVTMNPMYQIIDRGFITISGNTIMSIGEGTPKHTNNLVDMKGKLIIPGFVNAHTHLPMTIYRGIADDLPLKTWLEDHIWPAEAKHTVAENVRKGARLGLAEMIRTGTTTFCDMYFFADIVASESVGAGVRAVLNEAILDFSTNSYKTIDEALLKAEQFVQKWKNHELITPSAIFHATYSCSRETLLKVKKLAETYDLPITTHISETREEVAHITQMFGLNPPHYLESLGLLSNNMLAAHGVWLTEEDQLLFVKNGSHIVHCPSSNLKLGSGIAPIANFLAKGINVALGTDGCASNNNLDMVEEMRLAALLQKGVNHNPELIPAREALKMATLNGAKALGLGHKTGSIEVGKWADLVIIDTENTFMQPIYNYYSAIVYAMNSSCIDTVLVNGKVLMKEKKLITINEDQILGQSVLFGCG